MSWELWDTAIDDLVTEILETLAVREPPVNALFIVRAVGCELVLDAGQTGRARQKTLQGQTAVFLKPEDRPERLQWAAAHELGEIFAWKICERAGESVEELPHAFREQLANRFASRLMLPHCWFVEDLLLLNRDLYALKGKYQSASHELISRRLLDYHADRVLTIIDQGRVVLRQNGFQRRPGPLSSMEREFAALCAQTGRVQFQETGAIRCEAWPIHEPGWKREILFTYACGEAADDSGVAQISMDELTC